MTNFVRASACYGGSPVWDYVSRGYSALYCGITPHGPVSCTLCQLRSITRASNWIFLFTETRWSFVGCGRVRMLCDLTIYLRRGNKCQLLFYSVCSETTSLALPCKAQGSLHHFQPVQLHSFPLFSAISQRPRFLSKTQTFNSNYSLAGN